MTGALTIRWPKPEEAEEIGRLLDVLNAHVEAETGRLTGDVVRRDLIGAERAAETLVAEFDGRLVGCATFFDSYESEHVSRGVYLLDLVVDPGARRLGVARKLIATLSAETKRRGRNHVWWSVWPPNTGARSFYATLGATSEEMIAQALHGEPFDTLAEEGAELDPPPIRNPSNKV
ncbi:MAG: GNAT family N-acetyltransferase [Pseudomonadota bacterium]